MLMNGRRNTMAHIADGIHLAARDVKDSLGTIKEVKIDYTLPEPIITVIGHLEVTGTPVIQVDFLVGEIREYELGARSSLRSTFRPISPRDWTDRFTTMLQDRFGYLRDDLNFDL